VTKVQSSLREKFFLHEINKISVKKGPKFEAQFKKKFFSRLFMNKNKSSVKKETKVRVSLQ